jgi:hypothetical protein
VSVSGDVPSTSTPHRGQSLKLAMQTLQNLCPQAFTCTQSCSNPRQCVQCSGEGSLADGEPKPSGHDGASLWILFASFPYGQSVGDCSTDARCRNGQAMTKSGSSDYCNHAPRNSITQAVERVDFAYCNSPYVSLESRERGYAKRWLVHQLHPSLVLASSRLPQGARVVPFAVYADHYNSRRRSVSAGASRVHLWATRSRTSRHCSAPHTTRLWQLRFDCAERTSQTADDAYAGVPTASVRWPRSAQGATSTEQPRA